MASVLNPVQFIMIALSGWINQHQLLIIDYLGEENRVLGNNSGIAAPNSTTTSAADWPPRPKGWDGRFWLTWPPSSHLKPCWLGIANSSPRNMTVLAAMGQVGLARLERSRRWWFGWQRRIGIGAIDVSRARYPTWDTN